MRLGKERCVGAADPWRNQLPFLLEHPSRGFFEYIPGGHLLHASFSRWVMIGLIVVIVGHQHGIDGRKVFQKVIRHLEVERNFPLDCHPAAPEV